MLTKHSWGFSVVWARCVPAAPGPVAQWGGKSGGTAGGDSSGTAGALRQPPPWLYAEQMVHDRGGTSATLPPWDPACERGNQCQAGSGTVLSCMWRRRWSLSQVLQQKVLGIWENMFFPSPPTQLFREESAELQLAASSLTQRAEPSGLSSAQGDASLRDEPEGGSCRGAGSCKVQKMQNKRPCALEPPPCLALLLVFTGRQHCHVCSLLPDGQHKGILSVSVFQKNAN